MRSDALSELDVTDWDAGDLAGLLDQVSWTAEPFATTLRVTGMVDGRTLTRHVAILTVGRMQPMTIPQVDLPWMAIPDQLGIPLEWSAHVFVRHDHEVREQLRRVMSRITSQTRHYQLEHDQDPPTALREQHDLAAPPGLACARRLIPEGNLGAKNRIARCIENQGQRASVAQLPAKPEIGKPVGCHGALMASLQFCKQTVDEPRQHRPVRARWPSWRRGCGPDPPQHQHFDQRRDGAGAKGRQTRSAPWALQRCQKRKLRQAVQYLLHGLIPD